MRAPLVQRKHSKTIFFKIPEANLVLLTGLFGARANARVPTRRAGKHACTGLVHLDAKFRIRRSILGKFRSNFDLEGHTGREFEWYEYLAVLTFFFFFF